MNPEWIGCVPHNFRPGRPVGYQPQLIVIHVIVGSLLSADRWFNNPVASVSAHYGVGCDGRVHQYVAESDTAFHAGIVVNPECELVMSRPNVNPNYYSIGIEHEGQPGDAWTDEQAAASAALIADIARRWNIPVDSQHVIQHHEVRASKTCPGGQEKVDLLIARARTAPVQDVPTAPASSTPVQSASVDQGGVRTVANVRLRRGAPSTNAPVAGVLQIHTLFNPVGAVIGESVQGNAAWYRDADGNFIWAGGTDTPHPTT